MTLKLRVSLVKLSVSVSRMYSCRASRNLGRLRRREPRKVGRRYVRTRTREL